MCETKQTAQRLIENHADFLTFDHTESLVIQLSARIRDLLAEAIRIKKCASLIVSGGTTPMPLFEALSHIDLEWNKIIVALVDERWVEATDSQSNQNLVSSHLLKDKAAASKFIGMKSKAATAKDAEHACSKRFRNIPMPFDVVILGMGTDGHTASWFPGARELAAAVDENSNQTCISLMPDLAPLERMTLTLPAVLNAHHILIHIEGEEKRQTYTKAIREGLCREMPIRYVLGQEKVPVTVYWSP